MSSPVSKKTKHETSQTDLPRDHSAHAQPQDNSGSTKTDQHKGKLDVVQNQTLDEDQMENLSEVLGDQLNEEDEQFGLNDDDQLGLELDKLTSAQASSPPAKTLPLPRQLPERRPGQRRRLVERRTDQLPARRTVSTSELLVADELSRYLHEVRRYPLLDREEERALAERYYEDDDRESAKQLITGNLRLVVKIAQQYRRAWVNVMDLIQEGNIGLGEAVKRFDPYRGVRFSSFARYWIRALILQFILKNFRLISFANTRAGRKLFFRLEKERTRLMQLYGEATTSQLAIALEVSEEDIEAATLLNQPMLSLDAPRYQNEGDSKNTWEGSIQDNSPALDASYAEEDYRRIVNQYIQRFGEKITHEREIIIWRERMLSDDPTSLSALGERFKVSRERVRQLEQRLKDRLRDYLKQEMGSEISVDVSAN